jgi:hypothetical protein
MERLGVTAADEVGIGTLTERMQDEIIANDSVIVPRSEIAAWARVQNHLEKEQPSCFDATFSAD